jgi:predicted phosphodiesterase
MENTIAVISDIHGNTWALDAVLEDIIARDVSSVLNLGDSFYGPLDPAGTYALLTSTDIISIAGNEDRLIVENYGQDVKDHTLQFVIDELDDDAHAWLNHLNRTITIEDIFYACHGSPGHDSEYLLERVTGHSGQMKTTQEVERCIQDISQPVIICGHSHIPRILYTSSGHTIINPGSVGCPAYTDTDPIPHAMETGNPYATYSLITMREPIPHIQHIHVPYDWTVAARSARKQRRSDWALWLTTGRT